jgi:formate hydrogenlyase subunit 6/NADH:ubiquinone oxidoreductase subunit I
MITNALWLSIPESAIGSQKRLLIKGCRRCGHEREVCPELAIGSTAVSTVKPSQPQYTNTGGHEMLNHGHAWYREAYMGFDSPNRLKNFFSLQLF